MTFSNFPLRHYFIEKEAKSHDEDLVIVHSQHTWHLARSAAASQGVGVTDVRSKTVEKLIEILLAAVSAALCAAIDHFINKED